MPRNFLRIFLALLIVSFLVFAIGAYLAKSFLAEFYLPVFPWMILYFFVINASAHFFKLKATEGKPGSFPRKLMAINGIRIFVYLIFITIYLFLNRDNAKAFLVGFLSLYFVYFIFDLFASKKYNR